MSKQLGVLSWMSAEFGFTPNFDPIEGLAEYVFQPEDLTVLGSLGVLLKL